MIWYESGGEGSRGALLLHGLGATAAVWNSVRRALQERGTLRWLAADLGGHGGSDWQSFYSVGELAGQLGGLVQQQQARELFIVGHSLGAYVGLALASGWFGLAVRGVLGIGPKISWPAEDLQAARSDADVPGPPVPRLADLAQVFEPVADDDAIQKLQALVAELPFHAQAQW